MHRARTSEYDEGEGESLLFISIIFSYFIKGIRGKSKRKSFDVGYERSTYNEMNDVKTEGSETS